MADHKLVPVEPTAEMVKAACDEEQRPLPMWTRMKAIYTAMLAAAPQPDEQQPAPDVTVTYDLSPASVEGAIRDRLIAMGWTPPSQHAPETVAPAEQQQRIAKLEAINLGLTTTLVELHAEKAGLVAALEFALTRLEEYAVTVDAEWGECRDISELEADNALPESIKVARAALAKARGGSE